MKPEIPTVYIKKSTWRCQDKEGKTCYCADYSKKTSGCGCAFDTLDEAFSSLEKLAKSENLTLDKCKWSKYSDFTMTDWKRARTIYQPDLTF